MEGVERRSTRKSHLSQEAPWHCRAFPSQKWRFPSDLTKGKKKLSKSTATGWTRRISPADSPSPFSHREAKASKATMRASSSCGASAHLATIACLAGSMPTNPKPTPRPGCPKNEPGWNPPAHLHNGSSRHLPNKEPGARSRWGETAHSFLVVMPSPNMCKSVQISIQCIFGWN